MAKISQYTQQTSGGVDVGDLMLVVDVSDTSMGSSGTEKVMRVDDHAAAMAPILTGSDPWTSLGNITGTLTVPGNSTTGGGWTNLGNLGTAQTLTG